MSRYLHNKYGRVASFAADIIGSPFRKKQKRQVDPTLASLEGLDAFIGQQLASQHVPGAAVAVVANGDVVWSKGYGATNLATQQPVTTDTPFGLGSISKTFIGVALMQAIEDGVLTLDTEINDVLPFAVHNPRLESSPITVRQFLSHTTKHAYA